jgi:hypothetical protein
LEREGGEKVKAFLGFWERRWNCNRWESIASVDLYRRENSDRRKTVVTYVVICLWMEWDCFLLFWGFSVRVEASADKWQGTSNSPQLGCLHGLLK